MDKLSNVAAKEQQNDSGKTQPRQTQKEGMRTQSERRPALIFLRGELMAVSIPLERDEVVLGRAVEADVRVNDHRASRLHARISAERNSQTGATHYKITDLGSTNGTLLNGQLVTESILNDGDKVVIGDHLFRFEMLDEIDREFQQQIHRLIAHDELTGLLTSKSFFSELRRESARAADESRPFCVLMMDLDHFKEVNDTYGHLVGSKTLEETGRVIKEALRAGDVAARFGSVVIFLIQVALALEFLATDPMRFVPMYFGAMNAAVAQAESSRFL